MADPQLKPRTYYIRKTHKRPYKKSTQGCKECKTRKIKCDEVKPVCGNCTRRYVGLSSCEYLAANELSSAPNARHGSRELLSLRRSPTLTPTGVNSSHVLQLRLMHHYTMFTCGRQINSTVPLLPLSLWSVDIPQIAFSSELVLNALLGISAMHLLSLNPKDKTIALASKRYLDKAVQQHRMAVEFIDTQDSEAVVIAAVLIAHQSWLLGAAGASEETYKIDLTTYKMCQGINALVARAAPWLIEGYTQCIPVEDDLEAMLHPKFMESALEDIDTLLRAFDAACVSPKQKEHYEIAAQQLMAISSRIARDPHANPPIEQDMTGFLHRLPQEFLEYLETNEPIAMALLARNIACLQLLPNSDAWWIHGAGQWKVAPTSVRGILALMPTEYLWTMEWPMKIICGEITLEG